MRKILLILCLLPTLVYAAPADVKTTQLGRLTFQYPATWVGLSVEEGAVGVANQQSALDALVNDETLAADEVVIIVINDTYVRNQYYFDTPPTLAEIATEMQNDTGIDDLEFAMVSQSDTEVRMEGKNSAGMAAVILVQDMEEGVMGVALLAAAGQIREYETPFQNILDSLAYLPANSMGFDSNAALTLTYTTFTQPAFAISHPAGAFINEFSGAVIISNSEAAPDVGGLDSSGEVIMAFFSDEFNISLFGESEVSEIDAAALMELYRADILGGGETQASEINEMTIGNQTILRSDIKDEAFEGILLTIDTENGAFAALLATTLGERELFERLFFEMVASVQ